MKQQIKDLKEYVKANNLNESEIYFYLRSQGLVNLNVLELIKELQS